MQCDRQNHPQGSATVIALIFLVVLSAIAVGFGALFNSSIQVSRNEQAVARAQAAAESGLQVFKNYLTRIVLPPTVRDDEVMSSIASQLSALAPYVGGQPLFSVAVSESGLSLSMPATANAFVPLYAGRSDGYRVTLVRPATPMPSDTQGVRWPLTVSVTGYGGDSVATDSTGARVPITRTVNVTFKLNSNWGPFSTGIYTNGSITIGGTTQIAGDLGSVRSIFQGNPAITLKGNAGISGTATILPTSSVSGKTGNVAGGILTNPETYAPPDFEPSQVTGLLSGQTYTGQLGGTFTNARIAANSTLSLDGGATFNGVLYIGKGSTITIKNAVVNAVILMEKDYSAGGTLAPGTKRGSLTVWANGQLRPIPTDFPDQTVNGETINVRNLLRGYAIMAPTADVDLGANGVIEGSIIAWTAKLGGGSEVTIKDGTIIINSPSANSLSLGGQGNSTITFTRSPDYVPPTWGRTTPSGKLYFTIQLSDYFEGSI
jgi:hypothetical protein